MPTLQRKGEVHGFPLRIHVPAHGARAFTLVRPRRSREAQVLDVRFTEDVAKTSSDPNVIVGEGFLLDLEARCLSLPLTVPRALCAKTILFALGLLAEHHGPATVASRGSKGYAPLPLHASAVKTRAGALVFCGHSTFGKTTIATKLLAQCPLLGEDLILALVGPYPARGKPLAYVAAERNRRVPVGGLFWLRKSLACALQPMAASAAAAGLVHPIFGQQRPENARHRLAMLQCLLAAVPCRELHFRKERAPLRGLLRKHGLL